MMMTRASMGGMDAAAVDEVVRRLVEGGRGGRQVQLSEAEIRQLCVEAKQVLLSQPNLLRIHAPVKICGGSLLLSCTSPIYACACSLPFWAPSSSVQSVSDSDCCGLVGWILIAAVPVSPCMCRVRWRAAMGNCWFLDSSLIDSRSAGIQ